MTLINRENISTLFLIPTLGIKLSIIDEFYNFGYENSYLFSNHSYEFPVLYLKFKPDKLDDDYYNFEDRLSNNDNFIEVLDLDDYTIIVFEIPSKYHTDYYHILKGRYSQTSKEYQKLFPLEEVTIVDGNVKKIKVIVPSAYFEIFNRTEARKKAYAEKLGYEIDDPILDDIELYDILAIDEETLILPYEEPNITSQNEE